MAEAYFVVEEYLWFDETIQGNVNVAGLVFDDLLEETLDLGREDVLTVFNEQLEDTLGITEAFTPYHQAFCGDTITIEEFFGTPLRVKQTVLNLIMTAPVAPVKISHVHMDVLHGIDIYWEEVSSELQCLSTYANAVPYYWEYIYESLDIDMTEPQPNPPLYLVLKLLENDLVNMRHTVEQEYLFNSKCFEELFVWPEMTWGWVKAIESSLEAADTVREIIGKVADDYLYLVDEQELRLKVKHLIDDRVFVFDAGTHEKYYLLTAADTIAIMEDEVSFRAISGVGTVVEALGISETVSTQAEFTRLATESLTFADIPALLQEFLIEEGLEIGDVDLARWVFSVLTESGFNVADIIG